MPNTPNTEIPYVPEGTLDPAAGLNQSLNVIDALLQPRVISMDLYEPPATGADGDMYIVADGASGDWAGMENWLARYVLEGQFWQFYEPGVQVNFVVNNEDGIFYVYDTVNSPNSWVQVEGGGDGGGGADGHGVLTTLSISSNTININHALGSCFEVELTANVTTVNHNSLETGDANWFSLKIEQDGVGGRTFSPPASWKYPSGVSAYTVSSGANDVDLVQGITYDNGATWLISYEKDYT